MAILQNSDSRRDQNFRDVKCLQVPTCEKDRIENRVKTRNLKCRSLQLKLVRGRGQGKRNLFGDLNAEAFESDHLAADDWSAAE